MRIALISDTHGNLPALEAVLAELQQEKADRIVFLGDAAAFGPRPAETLEALRALGCPCVMGNTDDMLLKSLESMPKLARHPRIGPQLAWGQAQIAEEHRAFLATFSPTVFVPFDEEGKAGLLCVHGSPRTYDDIILATTPDEELAPMLSDARGTVMAGGHTHLPMIRRFNDWLLFNPGSVGLPIEKKEGRFLRPPWAEYGLLTWENGRLSLEHRRVPIDLDAVTNAAARSGLPHADRWIDEWTTGWDG